MRRLPTRINLEGPESRRYALRPKRYVISASGRPLLDCIVFTAEALNMDARYGADGRTCYRATMSHPPSPFDRHQHQHVEPFAPPTPSMPFLKISHHILLLRFGLEEEEAKHDGRWGDLVSQGRGESGFRNSFLDY